MAQGEACHQHRVEVPSRAHVVAPVKDSSVEHGVLAQQVVLVYAVVVQHVMDTFGVEVRSVLGDVGSIGQAHTPHQHLEAGVVNVFFGSHLM